MPAHAKRRKDRDVEKSASRREFTAKLRRLAGALDAGTSFVIQVGGERIRVPLNASVSIEHEREGGFDELEFQLKWKRARASHRRGR